MRSFSLRCALLALAVLALLPAAPGTLEAHTRIRSSDPAAGAALASSPVALRLTFTEAPVPGLSAIELAGPAGSVTLGAVHADSASALTLIAAVPSSLAPGTYTVRWKAAAKDGHPTTGSFTFTVNGPTPTPAPAAAPTAPAPAPAAALTAGDPLNAAYSVIRLVMYAALVALIGSVLFVLLLLRRLRALGLGSDLFAEDAAAAARRIAIASAAVLLVAVPARLIAQASVLGVPVGTVLGVLWGRAWMLQALGAIVALGAALGARGAAVTRLWIAGLGAIAIAAGFSLSGHAAATENYTPLVELADTVHVLAAGGWVGTLLALVAAGIPAALRGPEASRGETVASLVKTFSPLALTNASILLLTGVVAAWDHLGGLRPLFTSDYGKRLIVKLVFVALVAVVGAVNWRILRPQLGTEAAGRRIRRSGIFELAFALLAIASTAYLVATPTPDEVPAAPASSAPIR